MEPAFCPHPPAHSLSDDVDWDDPLVQYPDVPTVEWAEPEMVGQLLDHFGEVMVDVTAAPFPVGFRPTT